MLWFYPHVHWAKEVLLTVLIRPHCRSLTRGSRNLFFSPKGSGKIILGWYSVYPAPNGVSTGVLGLRIFGDRSIPPFFIDPKTSCARTSLNDVQLLRAKIVTINRFWHIPMSKPAPTPMPNLMNNYLNISYGIPIYIYIYIYISCRVRLKWFRQMYV